MSGDVKRISRNKREPWYLRLARVMGFDPAQPKDHRKISDLIKSTSKHARGKVRPAGWREKRKTQRIMARESRRINRAQA